MSVSVYIRGLITFDEGIFKDMLDLKALCDKTGSKYPENVKEFFNKYASRDWEDLTQHGIKESMGKISIDKAISGKGVEYGGAIIDLSNLPKEVNKILVYMS